MCVIHLTKSIRKGIPKRFGPITIRVPLHPAPKKR